MKATIIPEMLKHYPVLLSELISIISPQYGGTFIDCTFGQGGYTKKILEFPDTKVIGLDRDVDSSKEAQKILDKYKNRFLFKNIKFSQIKNLKLSIFFVYPPWPNVQSINVPPFWGVIMLIISVSKTG